MTYELMAELEHVQVLSPIQVDRIRMYIEKKFEKYSKQNIAMVFADTVHKVLDNELNVFSNDNRIAIKKNVLLQAMHRAEFFLNGMDIFKGIIKVEKANSENVNIVKDWIIKHVGKKYTFEVARILDEIFTLNPAPVERKCTLDNNIKITEVNNEIAVTFEEHIPFLRIESLMDWGNEKIDGIRNVLHDQVWREAIFQRLVDPAKISIATMGMCALLSSNLFVGESLLTKYKYPTISSSLDSINIILNNRINSNQVVFDSKVESNEVLNLHDIQEKEQIYHMQAKEIVKNNIDTNMDNKIVYKVADTIIQEKEEIIKSEQVSKDVNTDKTIAKEEEKLTVKVTNNVTVNNQIKYKEIQKDALKKWLNDRNSILAEQPYFNAIIDTAKEYNLNPLVLFAITGQEQSFVQAKKTNAHIIANNPFNVHGSWKKYNTDIFDSSAIAAKTIIRLAKGCPEGTNVFKWINRKYAEDQNWWIGVNKIFKQLDTIK